MNRSQILILVLSILVTRSHCYKPVFLLHGILTGAESMLIMEEEIKRHHPGTKVYMTDRFAGWSSLENSWHQVKEIGTDIMEICEKHPEGIHLVGYSQGGLLARAILQTYTNHSVKNFISLSSPQAGQYGTEFLHLIFPNLTVKAAFELFYSFIGQHTSVGNYWNDPHHQDLFYKYSNFLPYVNNAILSTNSSQFREGLLKLDKMILVGGPDDGVITPWQSSHFAYLDENDEVVPLHRRDIYTKDTIGLKTLETEGKLKIVSFPNVKHHQWHLDVKVIKEAVLPFLD
ncbi:lysosomal thioesterase PPT2 homolog [Phlebotomus argentipes]|uniref:lysosomal thioesterase PPT2 homolog n=1 Tax=Phlebotomus argentipes TaxID=94469 RepID=UPI002892E009|nr:lysosomal thioesterase PPT2 homolog [Phlebotomus argentipes]